MGAQAEFKKSANGERRALLVGVQTYLDEGLGRRQGTSSAIRQLASCLSGGGWTLRLLLDDEAADEDRPLLANVLQALAWLRDGSESLLLLSGTSAEACFLPRDARASFLSRTALPFAEVAESLPEGCVVLLDTLAEPSVFEGSAWVACAGQGEGEPLLFGSRGPTRFLRALVRGMAGEAADDEGVLTGALGDFLTTHTVPPEGGPTIWLRGDPELRLVGPRDEVLRTCEGCGDEVRDASATFCPGCGAAMHLERTLDRGRYRLLRPLGEGGMGAVYLAEDTRLKVERAVKVLSMPAGLPKEEREQLRGRMIQEARAAQALAEQSHHVVRVFDVGWSAERDEPFLVMEVLRGQTLTKVMGGGQMSNEEALRIGRVMAETLAIAHAQGFIHRDLKPDNVMLVERGPRSDFVKLLDFGLVKADEAEVSTVSGRMMGTLQYMPPEQLKGERVDPRADVYSFGAVLYELLSGRRANPGRTQQEIFRVLLDEGVRPLAEVAPGLPGSLCALVDACLSLDREGRPKDASAVHAALASLDTVPSGYTPTVPSAEFSALPAAKSSVHAGEVSVPPLPPPNRGWLPALFALLLVGGVATALLWPDPPPLQPDAALTVRVADAAPKVAAPPDAAPKVTAAQPFTRPAGALPKAGPAKREGDRLIYTGAPAAQLAGLVADLSAGGRAEWDALAPPLRGWLAEAVSTEGLQSQGGALIVPTAQLESLRPKAPTTRSLRRVGTLWAREGARPVFAKPSCPGVKVGDRLVTARWSTPGYGSGRCAGADCLGKLARGLQKARSLGEELRLRLSLERVESDEPRTVETGCNVRP